MGVKLRKDSIASYFALSLALRMLPLQEPNVRERLLVAAHVLVGGFRSPFLAHAAAVLRGPEVFELFGFLVVGRVQALEVGRGRGGVRVGAGAGGAGMGGGWALGALGMITTAWLHGALGMVMTAWLSGALSVVMVTRAYRTLGMVVTARLSCMFGVTVAGAYTH